MKVSTQNMRVTWEWICLRSKPRRSADFDITQAYDCVQHPNRTLFRWRASGAGHQPPASESECDFCFLPLHPAPSWACPWLGAGQPKREKKKQNTRPDWLDTDVHVHRQEKQQQEETNPNLQAPIQAAMADPALGNLVSAHTDASFRNLIAVINELRNKVDLQTNVLAIFNNRLKERDEQIEELKKGESMYLSELESLKTETKTLNQKLLQLNRAVKQDWIQVFAGTRAADDPL